MGKHSMIKWVICLTLIISSKTMNAQNVLSIPVAPIVDEDMIVRISEIEILPEYLQQYNAILKEEASASVKLEPGVIAIFPMFLKETPSKIRILEIYANNAAYQSHLKTPHFQHYKANTLKMVKTLKLVDMRSMDKEMMEQMFKKKTKNSPGGI